MSKKAKGIIITLGIFLIIGLIIYFAATYAIDFVFDKVFNKAIDEMIQTELASTSLEEPETIIGEDGTEYTLSTGEEPGEELQEIKGKDGKTYTVKKKADTSAKQGSEEKKTVYIKKISELTPQEIQEIQALVSTADKMYVFNMVKGSLTKEDKKELKAMLESGNIDYGRCMQIANARLKIGRAHV